MSADQVAALVTAIAAGIASLVLVAVVVVLGRRVRELGRAVDELRRETVPLVHDARVVVDQAATEMVRVGDVLDSAEAVSATVDSASRLAYRAFSNPVVKVLAYSTGLGSALRRFFGRRPAAGPGRAVSTNGHGPAPDVRGDGGHAAPAPRRGRRRPTGARR
jgi:hypothetical protein